MWLPCDVALLSFSTPLKAAVARELVLRHRLNQQKAAEMLGVTQATISHYVTRSRGQVNHRDRVPELNEVVTKLASNLLRSQYLNIRVESERLSDSSKTRSAKRTNGR